MDAYEAKVGSLIGKIIHEYLLRSTTSRKPKKDAGGIAYHSYTIQTKATYFLVCTPPTVLWFYFTLIDYLRLLGKFGFVEQFVALTFVLIWPLFSYYLFFLCKNRRVYFRGDHIEVFGALNRSRKLYFKDVILAEVGYGNCTLWDKVGRVKLSSYMYGMRELAENIMDSLPESKTTYFSDILEEFDNLNGSQKK